MSGSDELPTSNSRNKEINDLANYAFMYDGGSGNWYDNDCCFVNNNVWLAISYFLTSTFIIVTRVGDNEIMIIAIGAWESLFLKNVASNAYCICNSY